jgi:hypothetical protein
MNNQHADLSEVLAEQRRTERQAQATPARLGGGAGHWRRRRRSWSLRGWSQLARRPAGQASPRSHTYAPAGPVHRSVATILGLKKPSGPWATLLRVAWLAILLGLLLQLALLLVGAGFGTATSPRPLLAETCRTVCWSLLVCVGVALGRVAAKGHLPLEGITGLLAAPLALTAANTLQKGVAEALNAAGTPAGPAPLWVLMIKAAEYACLGLTLGWLGRRAYGNALGYAMAGLVMGLVFGGAFLALVVQSAPTPLSMPSILAKGVNELLFPVGCALVVFIADVLGRDGASAPADNPRPRSASPRLATKIHFPSPSVSAPDRSP